MAQEIDIKYGDQIRSIQFVFDYKDVLLILARHHHKVQEEPSKDSMDISFSMRIVFLGCICLTWTISLTFLNQGGG